MTIDEIYRLVQTLANKEQRGFITPSDFNLLAKQAEMELYNKRLSIVMEKSQPKKAAGYYHESLSPGLAEQDIVHFLNKMDHGVANSSTASSGAVVNKTMDYLVSITTRVDEEHHISSNIPLDIVTDENINQILRSSLVKPSMEYPIALLSGSGSAKKIIVFPEAIRKVLITYYHYGNNPKWGYVAIAGKPVYDASNSTQFILSPRCHGELVIKILEYLGVSIREADVVQYAQANELKADS